MASNQERTPDGAGGTRRKRGRASSLTPVTDKRVKRAASEGSAPPSLQLQERFAFLHGKIFDGEYQLEQVMRQHGHHDSVGVLITPAGSVVPRPQPVAARVAARSFLVSQFTAWAGRYAVVSSRVRTPGVDAKQRPRIAFLDVGIHGYNSCRRTGAGALQPLPVHLGPGRVSVSPDVVIHCSFSAEDEAELPLLDAVMSGHLANSPPRAGWLLKLRCSPAGEPCRLDVYPLTQGSKPSKAIAKPAKLAYYPGHDVGLVVQPADLGFTPVHVLDPTTWLNGRSTYTISLQQLWLAAVSAR